MLPAAGRLRRPSDFSAVTRTGARAGGRLLTVHALPDTGTAPSVAPRVGFVVGRTVGPAVVRNRVRRRLRHLMADRLAAFAPGTRVVVRANAAAAEATSTDLAAALDAAVPRVAGP